jgi:hypothetical protein
MCLFKNYDAKVGLKSMTNRFLTVFIIESN